MKSKNKLISISFFLSVVFISISSFSFPQQIETKDGVRIVHNEKEGKWRENTKVSIKQVRTFGGIEVKNKKLWFNKPWDIALDKIGNIYILDYGNNWIKKITPEGKYMATLGRVGQGPGEFLTPSSFDIDCDGYLYVSEYGNQRIQVLTPEFKSYKTIKIIKNIKKIRCLKSGFLAFGGSPSTTWLHIEKKQLPKLMCVIDLEGNVQREFGDMQDYGNRLLTWWANWFDFDVDKDDNFYFSFLQENRIEKYSAEGNLLWRANRVLNYSMKLQDEYGIGGLGMGRTPGPPPVSKGIAVDDKGRVWVITLNRQLRKDERSTVISSVGGYASKTSRGKIKKMDIYKLEIFNPDGILLGEIQLDHIGHGIRIKNNYLFILDVENAMYYQYKIIEK